MALDGWIAVAEVSECVLLEHARRTGRFLWIPQGELGAVYPDLLLAARGGVLLAGRSVFGLVSALPGAKPART